MKISKADIYLLLIWMMVFRFYGIDTQLYQMIRSTIAIILFLLMLTIKRDWKKYLLLSLFPISLILSSIANIANIGFLSALKGISYSIEIAAMFFVVEYYILKRGILKFFIVTFYFTSFYFLIDTFQIIYYYFNGTIGQKILDESFFATTKFAVAYINLLTIAIFQCWATIKKINPIKKNIFTLLLIALSILLCSMIECSTVVVGLVIYTILILLPYHFQEKLAVGKIALIALAIISFSVVGIKFIISIPFVQNFIVNILNEDLTLTGRIDLYSYLPLYIYNAGLFGYGYESYITTNILYHGWYNAQNGIADILLNFGYLGVCGFCIFLYKCINNCKVYNGPIMTFIYTMIAISAIEIPFSRIFFLGLAILMNSEVKIRTFDHIFKIE